MQSFDLNRRTFLKTSLAIAPTVMLPYHALEALAATPGRQMVSTLHTNDMHSVLLTVVFVKGLLERLSFLGLEWTYLVIPLSILVLAASTRLVQFEDESPATKKEANE